MLERLEALPSSGELNWDVPLSVWRYYNETVLKNKPATTAAPVGGSLKEKKDNQTTPGSSKEEQQDSNNTVSTENSAQPLVLLSDPNSQSVAESDSGSETKQIRFRVTCTRSGRKHIFSSVEAAGKLGAGLVRCFGWKVQLKNPELEVLLNIVGDSITVAFALNHESKYKRNIVQFGPTTLRSTIAYGLLRCVAMETCYVHVYIT